MAAVVAAAAVGITTIAVVNTTTAVVNTTIAAVAVAEVEQQPAAQRVHGGAHAAGVARVGAERARAERHVARQPRPPPRVQSPAEAQRLPCSTDRGSNSRRPSADALMQQGRGTEQGVLYSKSWFGGLL